MADIKDIDIEKVGHTERALAFKEYVWKLRHENLALNIIARDSTIASSKGLTDKEKRQIEKGSIKESLFLSRRPQGAQEPGASYVAVNVMGTKEKQFNRVVDQINEAAAVYGGKLEVTADIANEGRNAYFFDGSYKFRD